MGCHQPDGRGAAGAGSKEDDSDSEYEEENAPPEDSPVETPAPRTVTSPIPLFGMPPPFVHVDALSVRDSVNCVVPKPSAPRSLNAKAGKLNAGLFAGKAIAATKSKSIMDPMAVSMPSHVDFMAS